MRPSSAYLAAVLAEALKRERLGRALAATAGSLDRSDYPEWESPEKISAWVHEQHEVDQEISDSKLNRPKHR